MLILGGNCSQIQAQISLKTDSLTHILPQDSLKKDSLKKANKHKIIPRVATLKSLACPGLGQIYNKQYWKLPLVYGALGTTLGIAFWNNDRYQLWLTNFQTLSKNPNDVTYIPPTEVEVNGQKYNLSNVTVRKDFYRRNRDYSYLFLAVFWGLNIIDANVSAHLKTFDMSDDISVKFEPDCRQIAFAQEPIIGAKIIFTLK